MKIKGIIVDIFGESERVSNVIEITGGRIRVEHYDGKHSELKVSTKDIKNYHIGQEINIEVK